MTATMNAGFGQVTGAVNAGFGRMDVRFDELAHLQQQGLALSSQQLAQLEAMRAEQARRFAEERAHRAEQERIQALYANTAGLLHESLLAVKATERRLSAPNVDLLKTWLQLELVSSRTRGLDPTRVDPAQRRDLVELRDQLGRCYEATEEKLGADRESAREWIGLLLSRRTMATTVGAAIHYLTTNRSARGVTIAAPTTLADAESQIAAAETRLAQLRAELPSPLPSAIDALARSLVGSLSITLGTIPPEAIERLGPSARTELQGLGVPSTVRIIAFRRAKFGTAMYIGASVVALLALALVGGGGAASAVGALCLFGAASLAGLALVGETRARHYTYHAIGFYRWLMLRYAMVAQTESDLADLRWARDILASAESWEASSSGGGSISRLAAWRPDVAADIEAVAQLN